MSLARQIEIEVEGVKARAVLHDEAAPNVCAGIWEWLPMELAFSHSNFCGHQTFTALEGKNYLKVE